MGEEIVYKNESYQIIGACFEVYKEKGCGFLEAVYQECLRMEFILQDISFVEHPILDLSYKGLPLSKKYVPDFLCYDKIIVEIKSIKCITEIDMAQTLNYLKATNKKLGILVNFGGFLTLEYQRLLNPYHTT